MSTKDIDSANKNHEKISDKIEQMTFNSIRKVLPDKAIILACKDANYQYRQRLITPIVTVLHMILAAIWPEQSFAASWHVLWSSAAGRFYIAGQSPSLGSVAKARARLPVKLWRNLFEWISERAQNLSGEFDRWRGLRIVLADGTCVSMSDKYELFEKFGTNDGYHGPGKYPLARLVTLCIANTMTVLDYAIGRYNQDENALLRPLLKKLRNGDLLIADRHFAAAHFYWYYKSIGLEFLTKAHHRLKISKIKRIESYSNDDFLGWLQINENYRKKNADLPSRVMVRFIKTRMRIRGRRNVVWFVTSLLDNRKYPANEIIELYAKRWRIETLFRQVKVNFSADVLRSQTSAGIHKEIAARLIAVNIVRTIMLEAAIEQQVDPVRISFVHAVRAIISFSSAIATETFWRLPQIYKSMLIEIAAHLTDERPDRIEPRMVRREWQHYPSFKITRTQWRAKYVA
jgi:hypothetical protein